MEFEEALKAMRKGAKIRHSHWKKDEYLIACYAGLAFVGESLEEIKKRGMSIAKMKGKYRHKDMKSQPYTQLDLHLIMTNDWEIIE